MYGRQLRGSRLAIYYSGTPLSSLFDPYVEGTKQCPAGEIFENGVDIRNKYAPAAMGSTRSGVGVKIGSTDIASYFSTKGSASYAKTPWNGQTYHESMGSGGYIDIYIEFHSNGTFEVKTSTSQGHVGTLGSGTWISSAQASNYEIYAVTASSTKIVVTNQLSTYTTISSDKYVKGRISHSYNSGIITETYSFFIRIRRKGETNYTNSQITFSYRIGTVVDGGGGGGGGTNPD